MRETSCILAGIAAATNGNIAVSMPAGRPAVVVAAAVAAAAPAVADRRAVTHTHTHLQRAGRRLSA